MDPDKKLTNKNMVWNLPITTHRNDLLYPLKWIAVITVEPAVKYSFVFKKYANELGSISTALSSPVFVLAHFPEQRLVIEPTNEE